MVWPTAVHKVAAPHHGPPVCVLLSLLFIGATDGGAMLFRGIVPDTD